jgi:membrane protein involved in colicin uptake
MAEIREKMVLQRAQLAAETERVAREEAEKRVLVKARRMAREEADRRAREHVVMRTREIAEFRERRAREEAEHKAKVEHAAREEAERKARVQIERMAREEVREFWSGDTVARARRLTAVGVAGTTQVPRTTGDKGIAAGATRARGAGTDEGPARGRETASGAKGVAPCGTPVCSYLADTTPHNLLPAACRLLSTMRLDLSEPLLESLTEKR